MGRAGRDGTWTDHSGLKGPKMQPSCPPQASACPAQPRWEPCHGLQLHGTHPDSREPLRGGYHQRWSRRFQHTQTLAADSYAGQDPPHPQRTRSRLLGKKLLLFQADNRPFPCKSLHAPLQTYPQSISAQQMPRLKGQTHRAALLLQRGNKRCLSLREAARLCLGGPQIPACQRAGICCRAGHGLDNPVEEQRELGQLREHLAECPAGGRLPILTAIARAFRTQMDHLV